MNKKLLLTSQGIPKELEGVFFSHVPKPVDKLRVSFVTTAAYGDDDNPTWLEQHRIQLRNLGIKHIEALDFKGKSQNELERILSNKDIIFVNGGNTFYLLYWVKKSGFDKILPNLLQKNKLYVGVSAGSYIACPTIEQATWKRQDRNKIGLDDLSALNLVPFLIMAHFEEKWRTAVENAAKSTRYPIVALNDTQAVLVENDSYKVVGKGKKELFNGFTEK